jgi:hypothetical protein
MKSYIKKLLNESMSNRVLMEKFIDFVVDYLSLSKNFKVRLTTDKIDIITTAYYNIDKNMVCVYIKDRAIVDIMRSVAHELVHHSQNENGELVGDPSEGADGSDLENHANAKAGEIIRIFGKQNPEIYG